MTQKKQPDQSQIDRFRETARQLESDEDETVFDEKLKAIASVKPTKDDAE